MCNDALEQELFIDARCNRPAAALNQSCKLTQFCSCIAALLLRIVDWKAHLEVHGKLLKGILVLHSLQHPHRSVHVAMLQEAVLLTLHTKQPLSLSTAQLQDRWSPRTV